MKTKNKVVKGYQEMVGYLYDQVTKKNVKAKVSFINGMVFVNISGYGDICSYKGEGEPVCVESFNNQARVIVWDDINKEDASHIISLEKAKEKYREDK